MVMARLVPGGPKPTVWVSPADAGEPDRVLIFDPAGLATTLPEALRVLASVPQRVEHVVTVGSPQQVPSIQAATLMRTPPAAEYSSGASVAITTISTANRPRPPRIRFIGRLQRFS